MIRRRARVPAALPPSWQNYVSPPLHPTPHTRKHQLHRPQCPQSRASSSGVLSSARLSPPSPSAPPPLTRPPKRSPSPPNSHPPRTRPRGPSHATPSTTQALRSLPGTPHDDTPGPCRRQTPGCTSSSPRGCSISTSAWAS